MKFPESEYKVLTEADGNISISLPFEVLKTFLHPDYAHPITVPSVFKDILIEKRVAECEDVRLVVDTTYEFTGKIREGWNNTGQYFQISSPVDQDIIDCFAMQEVIPVEIYIQPGKVYIFIKRREENS